MSDAVHSLLHALEFEFVRRALLAGLAASILCGTLGVFVVSKRISFLGDGIAHAAFGGLGLCYFLGIDPRIGAIAVAVACALVLGLVGNERLRGHDALIGVLYAGGMAAGILFLHKAPGYAPNLSAYLFGNLLLVTRTDLWLTLAMTAFTLLVLGVLRRPIVAAAFDEVFAFVQGVPVRGLFTLLLVLIALAVVVLIQVAGVVLVVALLTIPPLTGRGLSKSLSGTIAISVVAA
ncbi:MAG: metal ABC transporter permease, partial [Acidobacteriota bacterium]